MDYPYTKSLSSISRLFEEIRKVGIPGKVTVAYLKSIGFTSSNDAYLVGLLKGIGFVDSGGGPTSVWKEYRGHDHKSVMATAVRAGYKNLFQTYPDADKRDDEAIANLVRQNTNYGADTVKRVVGSFKALCELADFSGSSHVATPPQPATPTTVVTPQSGAPVPPAAPGQPVINLNIQLELPAQADEKFYDNFFAAMKKHLMP
jgi:hypothetical protein